jgi:hypothetical protein
MSFISSGLPLLAKPEMGTFRRGCYQGCYQVREEFAAGYLQHYRESEHRTLESLHVVDSHGSGRFDGTWGSLQIRKNWETTAWPRPFAPKPAKSTLNVADGFSRDRGTKPPLGNLRRAR